MNEDFNQCPKDEENDEKKGASSVEYGPTIDLNKVKRKGGHGRTIGVIVALVVVFSLLCGVVGVMLGRELTGEGTPDPSGGTAGGGDTDTPNNTVVMQYTDASAATLDGSVTAAVEKSAASVVEIITTPYSSNLGTTSGAGSGVIISEDSTGTYIVTNNHVIEGNFTVITVRTVNGEEYTAEIVGTDWQSDLAVLRIKKTGFKIAVWAKSADLKVGQTVLAIGNPLGSLGGSVSRGIVSGVGRTIVIEGVPMTLLQIDAAINPGNSGGGLFDMNGNLVGIVNAKSVATSIEGIGFAIPSDDASQMVNDILTWGFVSGRLDLGLHFIGSVAVSPWRTGLSIMKYDYAAETGVRINPNDVLISLQKADGTVVDIADETDYRSVIVTLKEGDTVKAGIVGVSGLYEVTLTARKIKN